jgi:hypothetical protein
MSGEGVTGIVQLAGYLLAMYYRLLLACLLIIQLYPRYAPACEAISGNDEV